MKTSVCALCFLGALAIFSNVDIKTYSTQGRKPTTSKTQQRQTGNKGNKITTLKATRTPPKNAGKTTTVTSKGRTTAVCSSHVTSLDTSGSATPTSFHTRDAERRTVSLLVNANSPTGFSEVGSENDEEVASPGLVAGTAVAFIVVAVVVIALIISFRKKQVGQNGRELTAICNTACRPEHYEGCDDLGLSSVSTVRSQGGGLDREPPRIPYTADGHVTSGRDTLCQQKVEPTYFEQKNYAGTVLNDFGVDTYNRHRLHGDASGRDSATLTTADNYDHLCRADQLRSLSDGDDYSHISRHGDRANAVWLTLIAEDNYCHIQNDEQHQYRRPRQAVGGGTMWTAWPSENTNIQSHVTDRPTATPSCNDYDHIHDTVRPTATPNCNDYELAKVISEPDYANLGQ